MKSPKWETVQAWIEAEIKTQDRLNRKVLDDQQTAMVRGRINFGQKLLAQFADKKIEQSDDGHMDVDTYLARFVSDREDPFNNSNH